MEFLRVFTYPHTLQNNRRKLAVVSISKCNHMLVDKRRAAG